MSAIPPNWLGSIIQTRSAQNNAARARHQEASEQARQKEPFQNQLQEVIENTDRDSQVYSDAEGTGSQGRSDEPPTEPDTQEPGPDDQPPAGGLDLTA